MIGTFQFFINLNILCIVFMTLLIQPFFKLRISCNFRAILYYIFTSSNLYLFNSYFTLFSYTFPYSLSSKIFLLTFKV